LSVYSRSLGLVMGLSFLLSWLAQSISGQSAYNEEQLAQLREPISWGGYLSSAELWNSPESKPVGAPHSSTGLEG